MHIQNSLSTFATFNYLTLIHNVMKIEFENEVLRYLNLPSIPLKEFDGKSPFKDGIAVVELTGDRLGYAVATFDEGDKSPRIKKTFSVEPFGAIRSIFVVPTYMNTDVEHADVDSDSKKAMEQLANEAEELENDGVEHSNVEMPQNEWCFNEIHNIEEATAWLKSYNSRNKIRGKLPKDEETIKLRLFTIWKESQNKK